MADKSETAEARHRLANVFQLLSTLMRMRIQRAEDEETRRQLSWMLDTVTALGFLHRRAPGQAGGDFGSFLHEMAPTWRKRCEGAAVRIEVEAEPLMVTERDESALVLIVHELVSNAIAHGFPDGRDGLIRITLARVGGDEGRAELAVVDNGCGYDAETVTRKKLGLWLISGLASQAQATVTTASDHGVAVRLNFALPAVRA
jgi:two-component sensor histidine kinase